MNYETTGHANWPETPRFNCCDNCSAEAQKSITHNTVFGPTEYQYCENCFDHICEEEHRCKDCGSEIMEEDKKWCAICEAGLVVTFLTPAI